jgi:antimicrobial peptide system SdpA family protein
VRGRDVARLLAGGIVCLVCLTWLDSPLRPPATRRLQLLSVAPQFWGYFAFPRKEQIEVFRRDGSSWARVDAPLAAPGNLFGLRRSSANHGAEFRSLEEQVGTRWSTADLAPEQLPDSGPAVPVKNPARHPRLCGEVLFVRRPPVPWAWARSSARVALPTRFAQLEVQC